jgi:hypothetical protein
MSPAEILALDARIIGNMVEDGRLTLAQVESARKSLVDQSGRAWLSQIPQPQFPPPPVMPRVSAVGRLISRPLRAGSRPSIRSLPSRQALSTR